MLNTVIQGYVDAITVATSLRPPELPAPAARDSQLPVDPPAPCGRLALLRARLSTGWGKIGFKRDSLASQAMVAPRADAPLFFASDH